MYVHLEVFTVSKSIVKTTLASAKSEYYNKKIKASKGNLITLFSVVNNVLHKSLTVLQIISTQIKIWPIVLITSFVKKINKYT